MWNIAEMNPICQMVISFERYEGYKDPESGLSDIWLILFFRSVVNHSYPLGLQSLADNVLLPMQPCILEHMNEKKVQTENYNNNAEFAEF